MKKTCAILMFVTFLLLQANRWTLYMGCRIKNMYSAASCDCTPVLSMPDAATGEEHNTSYTHWHPDDFFYPSAKLLAGNISVQSYTTGYHPHKAASGYLLSRFKPPAVFS
jgi:hypothetical protein